MIKSTTTIRLTVSLAVWFATLVPTVGFAHEASADSVNTPKLQVPTPEAASTVEGSEQPQTAVSPTPPSDEGLEPRFGFHLQERARFEFLPDGDFTDAPSGTAAIGNRARLGVFGSYGVIGAHIEFQDVRSWGSEHKANTYKEGTLFDASANDFDVHQAYGEVIAPYGLNLRVGRQEIAWNGQRLIGAVGWAHQGRSFDAVRLRFDTGAFGAEVFYSLLLDHPIADDVTTQVSVTGDDGESHVVAAIGGAEPATRSEDTHLIALRGGPRWDKALTLDGLLIIRHDGAMEETLATFGAYGKGSWGSLYYEGEAYGQAGTRGPLSILAYLVGVRAGVILPELGHLKVGGGLDIVSGDEDPDDDEVGSFDTLYATNHKFYGHMDRYLALPVHTSGEGLIDGLVTIGMKPLKTLSLSVDAHLFASVNPQVASDRFHGVELDFNTAWRPIEGFALVGGVWTYIPGPWQAGNGVEVGGYVMTNFTFTYRN